MKHNTFIKTTGALSILVIGLGLATVQAQAPKNGEAQDIESSDPFLKIAAGAKASSNERSAEMLDAQARILFARGETEEALALQKRAVEKAERNVTEFSRTLSRYMGRDPDYHKTQQKLDRIIIPTVNFKDVALEDAVGYIRQRARELDVAEKDGKQRGINLIIMNTEIAADALSEFVIPELRLANVPLRDLLNYICEITGMEMAIEPHAVVLRPVR